MPSVTPNEIRRIVGHLRTAKASGRPSAFLIGAGAEREDLIRPYLDAAKLNWAHIALAQLIEAGYVSRVLSFNFDLVLEKAASLLGMQVPVYDFAASPQVDVTRLASPAIVHLHGQSFGFVMLDSDKESDSHRESLEPLFRETLLKQQLFVIGYSGAADASLRTLETNVSERHRLIWMGYSETMPSSLRKLMSAEYAEYVGNADFDATMIDIARELDVWPPPFVKNPIRHLMDELDPVTPYPVPHTDSPDILGVLRDELKREAARWDETENRSAKTLDDVFKTSSRRVDSRPPVRTEDSSDDERTSRAWVAIGSGNEFLEAARARKDGIADGLFERAVDRYRAALEIEPNMHVALNNWGNALAAQAETIIGGEADSLFEQAAERFRAALEIKPDMHEALSNWGGALLARTKMKTGEEADALFEQAEEKLRAALEAKPDLHEALDNWGIALAGRAKLTTGEEADTLFEQAEEKLQAATAIEPGETYNMACLRAVRGRPDEAVRQLEIAASSGICPSRYPVEADPDMASLRERADFRTLLDTLP